MSDATETRKIIVGIVTTLVLFGLLGVSYVSANVVGMNSAVGTYRLFATFNRVDGLSVGDPVMVSGVRIGEVESMTLDDAFRARVVMKMDDTVPLPSDTAAAIHTESLFGGKFISLDPGGSDNMVHDGSIISFTQDAVVVSELLDLVIAEGKANRAKTDANGEAETH